MFYSMFIQLKLVLLDFLMDSILISFLYHDILRPGVSCEGQKLLFKFGDYTDIHTL